MHFSSQAVKKIVQVFCDICGRNSIDSPPCQGLVWSMVPPPPSGFLCNFMLFWCFKTSCRSEFLLYTVPTLFFFFSQIIFWMISKNDLMNHVDIFISVLSCLWEEPYMFCHVSGRNPICFVMSLGGILYVLSCLWEESYMFCHVSGRNPICFVMSLGGTLYVLFTFPGYGIWVSLSKNCCVKVG